VSLHLSYLLYLPRGYGSRPEQRWPLILFLHGAGERGDDLGLVKKHGIPKIVEERDDLPFIAVSPQCPTHSNWAAHIRDLDGLLTEAMSRYAVDLKRVYLTGLSMGGFGTWHLATAYPQRFAAIAPICGGVEWSLDFQETASRLKDVPVWAFHGAKDEVVPPEASKRAVEAVLASGGNARLTIYPEAGHDSWTETYSNPELFAWFLQHSR
jgi:predicted peptidase